MSPVSARTYQDASFTFTPLPSSWRAGMEEASESKSSSATPRRIACVLDRDIIRTERYANSVATPIITIVTKGTITRYEKSVRRCRCPAEKRRITGAAALRRSCSSTSMKSSSRE
jgi:hypothetical protein